MDRDSQVSGRAVAGFVSIAVAVVLSGLAWLGVPSPVAASGSQEIARSVQAQEDLSVEDLVAQVLPAVVTVYNLTTFESALGQEEVVPQGSGTGFVISDEGHVITNWHVVTGGQEFAVMFNDGEIVKAELVGVDARDDLAMVRIDPSEVKATVPLGDSDALRQGQTVVAIGSPLGAFTNTVTAGVVSALGRDDFGQLESNCQNYSDLIQHDAAINPGNSGGPLFNLQGEVVGVNTLGLPVGQDGTPLQGLFFAVPSNQVEIIAQQLIEDGRISAPYIGIESQVIDPATARANNFDQPGAIYVVSVTDDSPAEDAGIEADDIILAVDGRPITMDDSLPQILLDYEPGDQVELTILRGNDEITVDLEFGNIPDEVLAACEVPTTPSG